MSSLRPIDFRFVDEMVDFVRGRGFVLDFCDPTFSQFFKREIGVDIDDPIYADGFVRANAPAGNQGRVVEGHASPAQASQSVPLLQFIT